MTLRTEVSPVQGRSDSTQLVGERLLHLVSRVKTRILSARWLYLSYLRPRRKVEGVCGCVRSPGGGSLRVYPVPGGDSLLPGEGTRKGRTGSSLVLFVSEGSGPLVPVLHSSSVRGELWRLTRVPGHLRGFSDRCPWYNPEKSEVPVQIPPFWGYYHTGKQDFVDGGRRNHGP